MSRIDDLSLFLRILDQGSISEAARSLDLSAAVASQRLKRLERELGVRLLQRTTRRLRPTAEGRSLAEQGREAVEDLEALMGGLHRSTREVAGTLRLTLPPTFGRLYVSPLLPDFLSRHPKLRLDLDLFDQRRDIVSSGFDLAIRIGSLADSSLVARRLLRILPDHAPPETGIHAIMPQRRLVPPRVRAFIDFLVEQWEPAPPWERHANAVRN
ncbi:LysR family transcriptional regulator [Billgrantia montanilacus]|uniref:LysR family transcriptional regulator n=1 Tax=Billgrantia montanilacus TaxID=2282305 RepID=A0A368U046_9GAMM|nr:LysR family transcriptional regulator [Halomonas montanilacus]RCV90181.1 LysR family transcriptional regulator [Halomonas montanilacus]